MVTPRSSYIYGQFKFDFFQIMEVLFLCFCMLFSSSYQNALKFNTTNENATAKLVENNSNPTKNENGTYISKYNFTIRKVFKIVL